MARRLLVIFAMLASISRTAAAGEHPANWNSLSAEQQRIWTSDCEPPSPSMTTICAAITALPGGRTTPAAAATAHPPSWNWLSADQQRIWTSNCAPPSAAMAKMCAELEALPRRSSTSPEPIRHAEVQSGRSADSDRRFLVIAGAFLEQERIGEIYHPGTAGTPGHSTTNCSTIGDNVNCETVTTPPTPGTPAWSENGVVGSQVTGSVSANGHIYELSCVPKVFHSCRVLFHGSQYQAELDGSDLAVFYSDGKNMKKTKYQITGVR